MSLYLEFTREALAELECVTGDYEAKSSKLGIRFRSELERACEGILQFPFLWREISGGWRRINLPGFPYYVACAIIEDLILVLAIAHTSRHPDYRENRIP